MPSSQTKIKNVYDTIAPQFSASRNYIWPDLEPFLKNIPPNSSVLDIGCGNGRLLLGLPDKIKYTGLDVSPELLKEAQKIHPDHHFNEADITKENAWKNLPQFDYVFCIAVIHHLPTTKDHLFLLSQISKHLKPGSKVLLTAWNLWQPKYLKHHLTPQSLNLKYKMLNLNCLYIPFQGHLRFHFAFTKLYFKYLLWKLKLNWKLIKSPKNYLIFSLPA